MRIIKINTTPSYDVLVQQGLLSNVGQLVNKIKSYDKIAIITDDVVQKLYLQSVVDSFKGFSNQICTYVFANGESSKNLIELAKIYDFLADNQITRTDLIIALGGGVCGEVSIISSMFSKNSPDSNKSKSPLSSSTAYFAISPTPSAINSSDKLFKVFVSQITSFG